MNNIEGKNNSKSISSNELILTLETKEKELITRYGALGRRMAKFVIGEDARSVKSHRLTKSISSEITFAHDISDGEKLRSILWRQVR